MLAWYTTFLVVQRPPKGHSSLLEVYIGEYIYTYVHIYVCTYIYIYIYAYWYYLKYSDYWLHLYCNTHNVSVDMSFSFLWVFHVELGGHTIETPEEGRRTYRPKRCEYNNKDEVSSPNILSDNNYHVSFQKLRRIYGYVYIYMHTYIYMRVQYYSFGPVG